jgi:hypothetical protein
MYIYIYIYRYRYRYRYRHIYKIRTSTHKNRVDHGCTPHVFISPTVGSFRAVFARAGGLRCQAETMMVRKLVKFKHGHTSCAA